MTALDMSGHIDADFKSISVTRIVAGGAYDDAGIYQPSEGVRESYAASVQPVSGRRLDRMKEGGRRITDARTIYINSGDLASIEPSNEWEFDAGYGVKRWETAALDCRPWRNYCKVTVVRLDDQ